MTIEKNLAGESKNVEFKETLPEKSIKYMKYVVAFAILTGNGGLHVTTQCGVFKGTTKAVFVDRREYPGPLWEQIDEAFQFVLRNIHLGATALALAHAFAYDNNIKNGVNADTNGIDGVEIGANDIKNDVFAELKEQGILEQQGNRRKAKWLIIKKR